MNVYSLYQVDNNSKIHSYNDFKNSFWCVNLDKDKLQQLSNFGIVHNQTIKYLPNLETICQNMLYKHINTVLPLFEYIRINNSGKQYSLDSEFDVLIVDESSDDVIVRRSETTIFYFLVLEKYFLRAHGLLEPLKMKFLKQAHFLNNHIDKAISADMQYGYNLKGLTAGYFDYSPALNKKLIIK